MKSNPSAANREGIRLKILGLIALLMVAVLIAGLIAKSHSNQHKLAGQDSNTDSNSNVISTGQAASVRLSQTKRASQSPVSTEPETDRLTALLLDKNTPLQARRQSARGLASIGTEQAIAALRSGLSNNLPPLAKVAIAESLGQVSNPETTALLHELVNGKDEAVARGAARGLATRNDADAATTLGTVLFNEQTPLSVRTEAALALGDVDLPAAQDFLTRAISQIQDEDVVESALDGMGRRPFSETEEFFRNYLNSPNISAANKVLAIEAVQDADGNVAPFLKNYVNDANEDVRTAAKDALEFLAPTK